ncbi:MAG TPA: hypothetical protein VNY76_04535 [Candidatus Acidoferrales bacterium]|jgi:hypothetical protein|nr:hypothetical protein [Candidatus Acidoferrales bacterium]
MGQKTSGTSARTVRVALLALSASAVSLVLVWRALPHNAPPVYDGICNNVDPYRTFGSSPEPQATRQVFEATSAFPTAQIPDGPFRGENPAQAQILLQSGTFSSVVAFQVSVTPVAPAEPAPPNQAFYSNVYRFAATTVTGITLTPAGDTQLTILLRATSSSGGTHTVVRLDGDRWTPLRTVSVGCGDIYEAQSDRLGDFAIVAAGTGNAGGDFPIAAVIVPALVVMIAAVTLGLIRLNRSRRA